MGLRKYGIGVTLALLCVVYGHAKTIMCEGESTPIPTITEAVRALHLRDVGAVRVYDLCVPATVVDLNLSANHLIVVPDQLVPQGIQRLWLADNKLLSLPKATPSWTHLIYINLDRNLFSTLPDLSATALRWLRVNHNQLTSLPALPDTIERLYLEGNRLQAFTISKPRALRHLTLANNPLTSIPDDLGCGLEELDLSGTKLTQLPKDLTGWQCLRVLNVARCPFSEAEKDRIAAAFDPLKTLVIF